VTSDKSQATASETGHKFCHLAEAGHLLILKDLDARLRGHDTDDFPVQEAVFFMLVTFYYSLFTIY
jgi:hypothetical protein